MIKKTIASLLVASSLTYAQSEVNLSMNNKMLNASAAMHLNPIYKLDYSTRYLAGIEITRTINRSRPNHNLINANFTLMNSFPNAKGLSMGLGTKILYLDHKDVNMHAVALGIVARYDLMPELYLDTFIYYSPEVLTFRDASYHREIGADINYKIIHNGSIFVGYKDIKSKTKKSSSNVKYNNNPYIGFKFLF